MAPGRPRAVLASGAGGVRRAQLLERGGGAARGGDGHYQYFHDGLPVAASRIEIVYRACIAKPGSFWVQDGAGQIVKQSYYLFSPYCPNVTPRP